MAEATEKKRIEETTPPRHRGWKAMPYIIGNETFEKLGTLGTSSNLLVYLTSVFHLKSATAATLLNVFNGTTNIAPLVGAFLSDSYFGRYFTLGFASVASFMGMFILTLTAALPNLHPSDCSQHCPGPTPLQLSVLLSAFFLLVIGAGGIRPCNLAFGADQFDPHTDSGRKGISSFFNWYYFTFTFAMMISATVIIYVQTDVSWPLGLAIPTALMFFSCAFFFVGSRIYVKVRPEGSPFTSVVRVFVAAFKKRGLEVYSKELMYDPPRAGALNSKLPYTDQFKFLDKASIELPNDTCNEDGLSHVNPWTLCTLQQVEEVKCLLRIIPIWSAGLMFNVSMVQQSNYVVFQALQSNRSLFNTHFEIPAGSFTVFTMLALTIWLPIYDRVIIPKLRRGITLLQRMGIGLILSILAVVVAAIIEDRRRNSAHNVDGHISSMPSLWFVPQLVLFGIGEAFNSIGQIEFYYKQFPENMRSIAGSLFFCSLAVSNYLSGLMVSVVNRRTNWLSQNLNMGRLDYFYFMIAGMGGLNLVYFGVCAWWYRYKVVDDGVGEVGLEMDVAKNASV